MFNWSLFLILVAVCVPGILVAMPRLLTQMEGLIANQAAPQQKRPSRETLAAVAVAQYLVIAAVFAAIGTALAPRVGLEAPFFAALAAGEFSWAALQPQLLPALLVGGAGALVFVAAYYGFFRARLDAQTLHASERLRNELGMAARVLYGGVYEEVVARWGLMSLFVWLGALLVGAPTAVVVWTGIVIAGIIFGLLHLPNYVAAGSRLTASFVSYAIVLNLWASLVFGWLFWQYGLAAAMLAHMIFHIVWWPFDLRYYRPETAAAAQAPARQ